MASNSKLSEKMVKTHIESEGYQMIDPYRGNKIPFTLICPNNHTYKTRWGSFVYQKQRCPYCAGKANNPADVRAYVESQGYRLNSEYQGSKKLLSFECPNGHEYQATWTNFKSRNSRCPHCAGHVVTQADVKKEIAEGGYNLVSVYKNGLTPVEVECDRGHRYKVNVRDFRKGKRCPACANGGFSPDRSASLYYVKFTHEGKIFYKIGITNHLVEHRFRDEKTPYVVLSDRRYLFGYLAKEEEQKLLKKHRKYAYKGAPFLISGNTELFTRDVLNLDR